MHMHGAHIHGDSLDCVIFNADKCHKVCRNCECCLGQLGAIFSINSHQVIDEEITVQK